MGLVLVVNAGSSSLKFALVDAMTGQRAAEGVVERIGETGSSAHYAGSQERQVEDSIPDHGAAFAVARDLMIEDGQPQPIAVGHRVVHGGDELTQPTVIDEAVVAQIAACVPLAPLHNPGALVGIAAAGSQYPDIHACRVSSVSEEVFAQVREGLLTQMITDTRRYSYQLLVDF